MTTDQPPAAEATTAVPRHFVVTPQIDEAVPGTSAFGRMVQEPVTKLVAELRALVRQTSEESATAVVTLLLVDAGDGDLEVRAAREALFEAMRGITGVLTLELASTGLRINLVRSPSVEASQETIDFLGRPDAGFVAGSTIDLLTTGAQA